MHNDSIPARSAITTLLFFVAGSYGLRHYSATRWESQQFCIDKHVTMPWTEEDAQIETWRTVRPNSTVPVSCGLITNGPGVLTFDACDTLIVPSQSVGRWYRSALNSVCEMQVRLPRPALFEQTFERVINEM